MSLVETSCFTAFVDILGISDLIERNIGLAREKLSLFHDHVRGFVKGCPAGLAQSVLFSDSLILVWDTKEHAIEGCTSLYASVFEANGHLFRQYSPEQFKYRALLLRGAISEGSLELQEESAGQRFVIGSALARSAKGESLVKGTRLLMLSTKAESHPLLHSTPLPAKGQKAYDVLWPLAPARTGVVERLRWVLLLCRLYADAPSNVMTHYRDTLWLFLQSYFHGQTDMTTTEQLLDLLNESDFIHWDSPVWLPISLTIAEGLHRCSDFRSSLTALNRPLLMLRASHALMATSQTGGI